METNQSIPIGLQTLLADLDFLGQIRRDTKPCCSEKTLMSTNSWITPVYRFMKGENRNNVVAHVEKIVAQTVDAINTHKNSDHIDTIINYFSNAREGIKELSFVYQNDPNITSKVNVQIEIIDKQLKPFRNLIKGYAEILNRPNEISLNSPLVPPTSTMSAETPVEIKMEEPNDGFPGLNTGSNSSSTIDLLDSNEADKRKFKKNKIKRFQDADKME